MSNGDETPEEGGHNPYMAMGYDDNDNGEWEPGEKFSYGINLWLSKTNEDNYWKSPDVRGAFHVPVMFDSQEWDVEPSPTDQPRPTETALWMLSGPEMQRPCIKRHPPYYVNVLFMDWSCQPKTIKELWAMRWHRNWPGGTDYFPVWPAWMANVPEPYSN